MANESRDAGAQGASVVASSLGEEMNGGEAVSRSRGRPRTRGSKAGVSVQALDRALWLLEVLAETDGLTLTELAHRAEIAPSTAHRLLTTLEARGHADQDPETATWRIGVGAFRVGSAFLRNRRLMTLGRSVLRRLMEETGETVNLGILDQHEVVIVTQFESPSPMRAFFWPGRRMPLHASGLGKAILLACEDDRVMALLANMALESLTERTITRFVDLQAEIQRHRARGWTLDDEEMIWGMRCAAAPIYDEFGEPLAGVSVSGPSARLSDGRLHALGEMVAKAAAEITASAGGEIPGSGRAESLASQA